VNIADDVFGKEVIDDSGIVMGVVKDVVWDFENNRMESLVVEKGGGGLRSIFGSGERNLVLYEHIHSIGDKILVNIKFSAVEKNESDEEENMLDRFNLRI
jgi:sporulation protein YlmC with PRC-barrel domain